MLSPNIFTKEKEILNTPVQTSTSSVLAILPCKNGMGMQEVIINNVNEFVDYFGEPTDYNHREWFQIWNFLQYSSPITVIRVLDPDSIYRSTASLTFNKFNSD
jgi:hypothetical protein